MQFMVGIEKIRILTLNFLTSRRNLLQTIKCALLCAHKLILKFTTSFSIAEASSLFHG